MNTYTGPIAWIAALLLIAGCKPNKPTAADIPSKPPGFEKQIYELVRSLEDLDKEEALAKQGIRDGRFRFSITLISPTECEMGSPAEQTLQLGQYSRDGERLRIVLPGASVRYYTISGAGLEDNNGRRFLPPDLAKAEETKIREAVAQAVAAAVRAHKEWHEQFFKMGSLLSGAYRVDDKWLNFVLIPTDSLKWELENEGHKDERLEFVVSCDIKWSLSKEQLGKVDKLLINNDQLVILGGTYRESIPVSLIQLTRRNASESPGYGGDGITLSRENDGFLSNSGRLKISRPQ